MLRVASVIKQVWSEHASDNIHWKLFRSSGHSHLLLLPSVSHHLCTSLCFRDGGEKEKKQEKADKEKGDCICAVQINTSITVIQSRGWHVIDLLCWILSADWVIALLIRISSQKVGNPADSSNRHIHIHIRTHTLSVKLHPVVLANQGPYNWRCRVSAGAGDADCLGVAVFVCRLSAGVCGGFAIFCWLASVM